MRVWLFSCLGVLVVACAGSVAPTSVPGTTQPTPSPVTSSTEATQTPRSVTLPDYMAEALRVESAIVEPWAQFLDDASSGEADWRGLADALSEAVLSGHEALGLLDPPPRAAVFHSDLVAALGTAVTDVAELLAFLATEDGEQFAANAVGLFVSDTFTELEMLTELKLLLLVKAMQELPPDPLRAYAIEVAEIDLSWMRDSPDMVDGVNASLAVGDLVGAARQTEELAGLLDKFVTRLRGLDPPTAARGYHREILAINEAYAAGFADAAAALRNEDLDSFQAAVDFAQLPQPFEKRLLYQQALDS